MSEIINYKLEFVKRTRDIIENSDGCFSSAQLDGDSREVTFLLNCLLGLVVAVSENISVSRILYDNQIDEDFKSNIPHKVAFLRSGDIKKSYKEDGNFTELLSKEQKVLTINIEIKRHKNLSILTKLNFLTKIRNAIAHQHIEGLNNSGEWVGVKLWNESDIGRNFEIEFEIQELKKFALYISEAYIKYSSKDT